MTNATITVPLLHSDLFGATKNRTCDTLKTCFRDGEIHLRLRDRLTGDVFESPAIFWMHIDDPTRIPDKCA